MMRHAWRDGLRALRLDVHVAATAVSLLAVTIGAITAVFAVVQGIVIRPFAFVDQDRVAIVWPRDDRRAMPVMEVAYGQMEDWRARSRTVADLAVFGTVNWGLSLAGGAEPIPVEIAAVSSSFFRVVGTPPYVGRPLEAADDVGAVPKAMVISHGLWTRRFGADPGILGRPVRVRLDAGGSPISLTVAGVMPPAFDFPRGADAWLPAAPLVRRSNPDFYGGAENAVRHYRIFHALARLREGVAVDLAAAELTGVIRTANREGGPEAPERLVVTPIADHLNGPAGPVLRTLLDALVPVGHGVEHRERFVGDGIEGGDGARPVVRHRCAVASRHLQGRSRGRWGGAGGRFRCGDEVQCRLDVGGQLCGAAHAMHVHVEDTRLLPEEVVMERRERPSSASLAPPGGRARRPRR